MSVKALVGSVEGTISANTGAEISSDKGFDSNLPEVNTSANAQWGPVTVDANGRQAFALGADVGASVGVDAIATGTVNFDEAGEWISNQVENIKEKF